MFIKLLNKQTLNIFLLKYKNFFIQKAHRRMCLKSSKLEEYKNYVKSQTHIN